MIQEEANDNVQGWKPLQQEFQFKDFVSANDGISISAAPSLNEPVFQGEEECSLSVSGETEHDLVAAEEDGETEADDCLLPTWK
ncbi:hypothetical protein PR048_004520 [Dryococelus australis]|uniref:Uncharacterized protein n=1 Tax=Dryococelus australis TaxID=614101 RepID=A0ABQ9I6N5_9NEOP|nr:hypothetical protein PR048_004520 [Dryococelus australis]